MGCLFRKAYLSNPWGVWFNHSISDTRISAFIKLCMCLENPVSAVLSSPLPEEQDFGLIRFCGCASAYLIHVRPGQLVVVFFRV